MVKFSQDHFWLFQYFKHFSFFGHVELPPPPSNLTWAGWPTQHGHFQNFLKWPKIFHVNGVRPCTSWVIAFLFAIINISHIVGENNSESPRKIICSSIKYFPLLVQRIVVFKTKFISGFCRSMICPFEKNWQAGEKNTLIPIHLHGRANNGSREVCVCFFQVPPRVFGDAGFYISRFYFYQTQEKTKISVCGTHACSQLSSQQPILCGVYGGLSELECLLAMLIQIAIQRLNCRRTRKRCQMAMSNKTLYRHVDVCRRLD